MAIVDVPRVIRRVRQRMGLSQEGLSRRLNATKGAIQHWERGRNQPDLARLFVLRSLCPTGPERKEVEALIHQVQGRAGGATDALPPPPVAKHDNADAESATLARENVLLRRQVTRLQRTVLRRQEQLRILEDLATELQRQVAELKAEQLRASPNQLHGSPAASE
jgi:transcriptional regulator with XRE-family HTH domain